MLDAAPRTPFMTPRRFEQLGRQALWLLFGGGVSLVLLLAWKAPGLLPAVPLLLLGGVSVVFVVRRPLLNLYLVVGGFAAILSQNEGVQWYEAGYGLYLLGYTAGWLTYRMLLCRERVLRSATDYLLVFFLVYATATIALNPVFGGSLFQAAREWATMTIFGLYFPIKEAARRHEDALQRILLMFFFIAVFIALRNFYQYYLGLQSAEALWEIMQNRERLNERILMVAALFSAVQFLYAERRLTRVGHAGLVSLLLAGIIAGQSRAVWVSFLLGLGVLFLVTDRRRKGQIVFVGLVGFAAALVMGAVLLDDFFSVVITGLAERFTSLGSATTDDVSLVNRFHEWRVAWGEILRSPILGRGFGVSFSFFNMTYEATQWKTYIHNAYLGLWYRHGLIGLAALLTFFGGQVWHAVQLYRSDAPRRARVVAIMGLAALAALALAATTEPMLLDDDGVFVLMMPAALIAGMHQRWRDDSDPPVHPA